MMAPQALKQNAAVSIIAIRGGIIVTINITSLLQFASNY